MNTTSLEQAAHWMGDALGLDPVRDEDEVLSYVNKYRNLLYNSWNRVQLFDDYEQCFTLATFYQDCHGLACGCYRGFTASLDMGGLMGSWSSLKPVTLRSRFREIHRGKDAPRGPAVEVIPVNGTFATERDMTGTSQLRLLACNPKDEGKIVVVTARTSAGEEHHLQFELKKDAQVTVNRHVCAVKSVALPVDLCGNVELYQEDGTLLATYPPGVPTPNFRRYKVHDTCDATTILIQSARVYVPVTEKFEVIEIGDQLTIQAAGRYFKYGENTIDRKEREAANGYREEMFNHINNIKERERGREHHDGPPAVNVQRRPRRSRRRGLPGYRNY